MNRMNRALLLQGTRYAPATARALLRHTVPAVRMSAMGKRFGSVTILVSLLGSSCYGDPEPADLTAKDNGKLVSLALHQEVDVTLQTIGPGQFGEPVVSAPAVTFEGMTFPKTQYPSGPTQLYRFRTVAAGTALVTIPHDSGSPSFTVTLSCCAQ
jgi:hypothetical protein